MFEALKDPAATRAAIRAAGWSEEKINTRVKDLQEEYAGLLTEPGALYCIALELGVPVAPAAAVPMHKIKDLKAGQEEVSLHVKVDSALAPKEFERAGKKGKLCKLTVSDDSSSITLVLWNRDAEKAEKIHKGAHLEISRAIVKQGMKAPELHLGMTGSLTLIAEAPALSTKIAELVEGQEADLYARVLKSGQIKEFAKADGGKGKMAALLIGDETGSIRLVLWDEQADLANKATEGTTLRIEGAMVKKGMRDLELHLGWHGRLMLNPKGAPELGAKAHKRIQIAQLTETDNLEIEATVKDVREPRAFYQCAECRAKATESKCEKCGSQKTRRVIVVNATVADGSGETNAVFFDQAAEALLGIKHAGADISPEAILALKRDHLIDKKLVLQGRGQNSKVSGQLEFVVAKIA